MTFSSGTSNRSGAAGHHAASGSHGYSSRNSGGYFSHHGVWAVGVKMFRSLSFAPKALLISAVFVIPLVLVFTVYLRDQLSNQTFAETEIQGVQAMRAFMPVVRAVIDVRNADRAALGGYTAAPVSESRAKVQASIEEYEKFLKESGDPLGFRENFEKTRSSLQEALQAAKKVDQPLPMGKLVDAMMTELQDMADKSNLSLDPDADTYYLQAAVTTETAAIALNIGQVRSWATFFAARGNANQDDLAKYVKDLRSWAVWNGLASEHLASLRDDLTRAISASPEIVVNLEPIDLVESYQKLATSSALEGESVPAARLWNEGTQAMDALFGVYSQTLPILESLLNKRIDGFIYQRTLLLIALALCLVVAGYLFYCFYLVMQGGLNEVRRHLEAMTSGDLTTAARPWGKDEVASLMLSLSEMQTSLRQIVSEVRQASDSIVSASNEIASASMDLSSRTEAAAADLEESAASMEEMSGTVSNAAQNAQQAATIASSNAKVAVKGGEVIGQVVSTMQEIHGSSSKIGEIIGTIDGIAFQTNILALNASVEAARAGEQGRGFAVVAGEVRNLAQRSAQAAKEIKALITSSVERVESGTRVVQGAGTTMRELVNNAQRMNDLLAEISTASKEQSLGITQIGTAVQDLDHMTEQNAALVEQTAAAATALKDQAVHLAEHVAKFKMPAYT